MGLSIDTTLREDIGARPASASKLLAPNITITTMQT